MSFPNYIQVPSPNRYDVRDREVDLVVIHYTAGRGNALSTAALFAKRKASAHFVIGRDGQIVQCVDLDDAAWHAGDGRFPSHEQLTDCIPNGTVIQAREVPKKPRDVNMRSIGIELCNCGWAEGGREYVEARHRNPASKSKKWEVFPSTQIEALRSLLDYLTDELPSLLWVTGHEDVTHRYTLGKPGGKLDPGPAFEGAAGWEIAGRTLHRVAFNFEKKGWVVCP